VLRRYGMSRMRIMDQMSLVMDWSLMGLYIMDMSILINELLNVRGMNGLLYRLLRVVILLRDHCMVGRKDDLLSLSLWDCLLLWQVLLRDLLRGRSMLHLK
jgi:hypothetical protein